MKLSVKLQPTAEGRSSAEIFRLLASTSPPPYLRCWKGEDGEPNKEKGSDDRENDGDEADGGPLDDNDSGQSSRTSRSSTPDPPLAPPALTPSAPDPADDNMDLLTKAAPTDISRTPTNPELMQPPEDDDDDGDDAATTKAAVEDDAPLDFSLKRTTEDESTDDDRSVTPNGLPPSISQDGPLDLSVPRRRAFKSEAGSRLHAKMAKLESALSVPSSPWGYNAPKHSPKQAAVAAGSKSEIVPMWNGKVKSERRDHQHHKGGQMAKSNRLVPPANNAAPYGHPMLHKNASPPLDSSKAMEGHRKGGAKNDPYRPAGRQNPWQSQWMSRSSEQTRDVFTCVWCKESFRSLADMTVHMKQSPRCGMAGMQTTVPVTPPTTSTSSSTAGHHHHHHHQQQQQSNPALLAHAAAAAAAAKCSTSSSPTSSAANAVIKENVSLPRKLVRGQDVWLGKGAEQTRQILKCMWCGQSFKTLADMTTHMRVTQHYTNIISQEQIISWRTPEDKMAAQSQVNAVLTCKVCDQAFGSLKELSYHMVKNSHYKEHILRSITEGGGRRRQTRERRKKSLPVRKLLELERMELSKQGPSSNPEDVANHAKSEAVDGKISCEECTEKVDAKDFVQHIKSCAQGSRSQHSVKSSPGGSEGAKSDTNSEAPTTSGAPSRTPPRPSSQDPHQPQEEGGGGKGAAILQQDDSLCDSVESTGSTSVLNAIEKLIEKSFESKGRRNAVSTGILQRLGIDEEVYPPWHPSSSPNAFGALRSTVDLQRKSTSPLGRLHDFKMEMADFSGSESRSRSSSISEKHPTSFDEHLRLTFGLSAKDVMNRVSTPSSASRSCSPDHFRSDSPVDDRVFAAKEVHHSNAVPGATPPPPPHAGAALSNCSPRARSATPCSDREPSEKGVTKDTADVPPKELVNCKVEVDDAEDKEASDEEKPVNCSREATPKSEDRRTPVSRSPSCEPDSSRARASPAARAQSPAAAAIKSTKSGSSKRKIRSSEGHRKSHSSSGSKRKSSSHRRKDSEGCGGNDSAMGSPMSTHSSEVTSPRASKHSDAGDHPLKELQKLLDKTDAHLSRPSLPATPGSILAFSWACSEATTSDSLMKCAFCDTHFISKGAYRHHLSKMHFVKDGSLAEIAAASTWKPPTSASGGGSSHNNKSSNGCNSSSAAGNNNNDNSGRSAGSPHKELLQQQVMDESPHSKFLKYTELAKQLSSKYV